MRLAAKLSAFSEISERRVPRSTVLFDASMRELGTSWSDVRVHNLSSYGFLAETDEDFTVDSYVWLTFHGVDRLSARIVWRDSFRYGCEFTAPLTPAQFQAGATIAEPPEADAAE